MSKLATAVVVVAAVLAGESDAQCPFSGGRLPSLSAEPGAMDTEESPPACWQNRLSQTYDQSLPDVTYNHRGMAFPNEHCQFHLGREYGFSSTSELELISSIASIVGGRSLKRGSFDSEATCLGAGMTNCCNAERDPQTCGDFEFNSNGCPAGMQYEHQVPSALELAQGGNYDNKPSLKKGDMNQRVRKQAHAKSLACLQGTLRISRDILKDPTEGGLPARYRVGLFSEARVEFPTQVRFSGGKNLTTTDAHDTRIRGLSLKISGVGEQCNRVKLAGVNTALEEDVARDVFGTRTFDSFQDIGDVDLLFIQIRGASDPTAPPFNIFPEGNLQGLFNGFINGAPPSTPLSELAPFVANPLLADWGTGGALALGKGGAMKLHMSPCPGEENRVRSSAKRANMNQDNFGADNINAVLTNRAFRRNPFRMCMYAQLQENPCEQPIEDASVRWRTAPIKVAELELSSQESDGDSLMCDSTILHPYRTLEEHFPLGALQRVRHAVYSVAGTFRTAANQQMYSASEWTSMMGMSTRESQSFLDFLEEHCYINCNDQ